MQAMVAGHTIHALETSLVPSPAGPELHIFLNAFTMMCASRSGPLDLSRIKFIRCFISVFSNYFWCLLYLSLLSLQLYFSLPFYYMIGSVLREICICISLSMYA